MSDRVRLSGLWESQSRSGQSYLGGSLGQARLLIFPNGHRKSDRDPSHIAYLVPRERQDDGQESGRSDPASNIPF